uniref:Nodule-specific cysteine-rich peptide G50 n=1 Tax=Pisum sativum TaxID=3888 RepID=A0A7T8DVL5_PEA|nr:nodule-specific cysteine-rich peptide G50 [Pisum sativum]
MTKTIKLVSYIILFTFLFIVVTDVSAGKWTQVECKRTSDCPPQLCFPPLIVRCYAHKCVCNEA